MLDSGVYLYETDVVIREVENRTKNARDKLKANMKEERGDMERKRRGVTRQRILIKGSTYGVYALGRALRRWGSEVIVQ